MQNMEEYSTDLNAKEKKNTKNPTG